jgi:hypothetical protein
MGLIAKKMLYKRNSRHRPIPRSETSIASITRNQNHIPLASNFDHEAIEKAKASNKKFHL